MNLSLTGSGVGNRPGLEGDNHKSYEEDAPMFEIKRRLNLQLFAEGAPAGDGGGAGGEGSSAATGENPAAAGREWLRANGAPEAAITDGRAEAVGRELSKGKANGKAGGQVAAAASEKGGFTLPEGTTWEQLMSVPWVNQQMQETVKKSKKDGGAAQKSMEALTPALNLLAKHYGLDAANLDHAALAEKIAGDDTYYEALALEKGVDIGTARQMQAEQQKAESFREEQTRQHYLKMVEDGKALASIYPGFDLRTELQNPAFARLTQPAVMQALGGLKGVYEAVHREELAKQRETAAAQTARVQQAQTIAAGGRPTELGGGYTTNPAAKTRFSGEEVRSIADRVRRGEKIVL